MGWSHSDDMTHALSGEAGHLELNSSSSDQLRKVTKCNLERQRRSEIAENVTNLYELALELIPYKAPQNQVDMLAHCLHTFKLAIKAVDEEKDYRVKERLNRLQQTMRHPISPKVTRPKCPRTQKNSASVAEHPMQFTIPSPHSAFSPLWKRPDHVLKHSTPIEQHYAHRLDAHTSPRCNSPREQRSGSSYPSNGTYGVVTCPSKPDSVDHGSSVLWRPYLD